MSTNVNNEPLDFCRVKKIDEKGFGFLKSLYYQRDVFFHFSQIKKEEFLEKLNDMKRGEFFLYFISVERNDGKRKAVKIWYSIKDVPSELLNDFTNRITKEFDEGKMNVYDLLFAFNDLRKVDALDSEAVNKILSSNKILNLPTTILPFLNESEISEFRKILKIEELGRSEKKPFWYDDVNNYVPERSTK